MDLDELIADCVAAVQEHDPRLAIRDVLRRALSDPALADSIGTSAIGPNVVYNAPDLTVLNVVWPPLVSLFPHDHRMWAAIGVYGGREDNAFYRRQGSNIVASGGKELVTGDVHLLGDDTIHSVHNPARTYTGAIHVYGGDFLKTPRSQWDAETLEEAPYDFDVFRGEFERAEREFHLN